jgi:hypothetical protein
MSNMRSMLAMAALASLSGGYGLTAVRNVPRARDSETPEEKAVRAERREIAANQVEARRLEREARKAEWDRVYNPTYATEPQRSDFPSRQAYREAVRKFSRQAATAVQTEGMENG